MNRIFGMKLDNVKSQKGEEHEMITADLLLDERKIGEIFNDGWCDEYYLELIEVQDELEFQKRLKKYQKKHNLDADCCEALILDLLVAHREYKPIPMKQLDCEQLAFLWN